MVKQTLKENYASRIASIRVDGYDNERLLRRLLKKGMALLETREVSANLWPGGVEESSSSARQYLSIELPRLRNLVTKRWEPPLDALWITRLQTLRIKDKRRFGPNTLRILSTCVNLQELELESQYWRLVSSEDDYDYSDVPSHIMLPKLRQLTMELGPNGFLGQIVRRLITPPDTRGHLHTPYFPSSLSDG